MTTSPSNNIWPTRLYYIFLFAGAGFVTPFLNLFFVHLGLHGTEIGWITAISAVGNLIPSPIWTQRNKRWENPRIRIKRLRFFSRPSLGHLLQHTQLLVII